MLHFQVNDQNSRGNKALPRASAFKAALDKSMYKYLERAKNEDKSKLDFDCWKLKNSDKREKMAIYSFDYKMNILGSQSEYFDSKTDRKTYGYLMFFNMGNSENVKEKLGRVKYGKIEIQIKSFVEEKLPIMNLAGDYVYMSLLDFIEYYINIFLIRYNFGFRALKGFGSFTPLNNYNDQTIKALINRYHRNEYAGFVCNRYNNEDYFFEDVTEIIKSLRRNPNTKHTFAADFFRINNAYKGRNNEVKMLFGSAEISKRYTEIERYPSPMMFKMYNSYMVILFNRDLIENFPDEEVLEKMKKTGNGNATKGYMEMVREVIENVTDSYGKKLITILQTAEKGVMNV